MGNGDKVTGLRAEPIFYYLVTSTKCINATVVGHEVTSLDSKRDVRRAQTASLITDSRDRVTKREASTIATCLWGMAGCEDGVCGSACHTAHCSACRG